jgi:ornithine cyclodeaminase
MLIVQSDQIDELITRSEAVETIEEALLIQEKGNFTMPDRTHVYQNDNLLLLMPAFTENYFSTKLVSVFPENTKLQIPSIQGIVVLNDGNTGEPLALFSGAKLTSLRTGAVGGAAFKWLSNEDIQTVGVIGAGVQGLSQALFARSVRNFRKLIIFDKNQERMEAIDQIVKEEFPDLQIHFAGDTDTLVRESECVITTTTANGPVFSDIDELVKNKLFIGIGSYKPEMQEFPDAVCRNANDIYFDTAMAKKESGDLVNPLTKGIIEEKDLRSLGSLIKNNLPAKKTGTLVFKSVGMALFDLIMAKTLYEKAKAKNIGIKLSL